MGYSFQILDISQDDIKQDHDSPEKEYCVTLYGRTKQNQTVVCHVFGFEPYFYIKIPSSWSHTYSTTLFLEKINKDYKRYINEKKLTRNCIRSYKELYGYHVDENHQVKLFSFLKLSFSTNYGMNQFSRSVKKYYETESSRLSIGGKVDKNIKKWIELNVDECDSCLYESKIPPIIKFIHDTNINPSGWIEINKPIECPIHSFKTELEIECRLSNIKPLSCEDINDFKIASFDIECDSLTGAFPLAIKDFIKPSQDVLTTYYSMIKNYDSYTVEEKIQLIKEIVLNLYKKKDNISIESICLKNDIDIESKQLDIYSEEFVNMIDKSIENKKLRPTCIQTISKCLQSIDYGKKYQTSPIQGDPIIQIGTVFYNYLSKIFERIIIVIGGLDGKGVCSDIDGIHVIRCKSESELLLKWKDLINEKDPDFITGYNILGFDFKYIYERAKELGVYGWDKKDPKKDYSKRSIRLNGKELFDFGRYKSDNNRFYSKQCKYVDNNNRFNKEIEEKTYNVSTNIEMDGRIVFDIQAEIKKGHSLDSYKLDNVSNHFMRGVVKDIKTLKIIDEKNLRFLKLTTNNLRQLKSNDYITLNTHSNVGQMMFMDGKKFIIHDIQEKTIYIDITDISINTKQLKSYEKVEWCLSKDDVPPSEIFRLHKYGGPDGRAKVGKYCIQDCELCIHLLLNQDIIPNNMGMSSVCMVPLSYIFSRGQGIKVTSVVSKICSEKNTRMPTLKGMDHVDSGFEGAIVLDPTPGIYLEDPIAVLDFASLYPSCIIENNCSHETYITDQFYINYLKQSKLLESTCNVITYDNYKYVKTSETSKTLKKIPDTDNPITTCYFLKSKRDENGIIEKKSMGILPTVLDHLLTNRSRIKKELKMEKDLDKKKVKDGLQLAYKVTANSVYGQLGFSKSSIYKKCIAACTTSIGRTHIYDAKRGVYEWAEKQNIPKPDIIYGDTDSVFIKFSRTDKHGIEHKGKDALKYCIQCGIDAGEYITKYILEYPQDLEYEKTYFPFVLLSKKRYIGDMFVSKRDAETNNCKRTSMGIVMKRRDNAQIVKYVFGNVIEKLLVDKNYEKTIEWLENTLQKIKDDQFHESYFIISKTLNSYYANPESIAHKVLADRISQRDPGNKPLANERIQFMFQKIIEVEPNGFEKIKVKIQNGYYKNGNPKYKTSYQNGKPKYKKKKIAPGDRIETPEFIKKNNIHLDYSYYISNQIMNPVQQLLEQHPKYTSGIFEKYIN